MKPSCLSHNIHYNNIKIKLAKLYLYSQKSNSRSCEYLTHNYLYNLNYLYSLFFCVLPSGFTLFFSTSIDVK